MAIQKTIERDRVYEALWIGADAHDVDFDRVMFDDTPDAHNARWRALAHIVDICDLVSVSCMSPRTQKPPIKERDRLASSLQCDVGQVTAAKMRIMKNLAFYGWVDMIVAKVSSYASMKAHISQLRQILSPHGISIVRADRLYQMNDEHREKLRALLGMQVNHV